MNLPYPEGSYVALEFENRGGKIVGKLGKHILDSTYTIEEGLHINSESYHMRGVISNYLEILKGGNVGILMEYAIDVGKITVCTDITKYLEENGVLKKSGSKELQFKE